MSLLQTMSFFQPKPKWIDSIDGQFNCQSCVYKTSESEWLQTHIKCYHSEEMSMVLYMECSGSIEGRNLLLQSTDAQSIDCTGGQAACADGNLETFGEQLVQAARDHNIKLYRVCRMGDPGLGLMFPDWWVDGGIEAGVFAEYVLPVDVDANAGG
jgi:hypothetical protein